MDSYCWRIIGCEPTTGGICQAAAGNFTSQLMLKAGKFGDLRKFAGWLDQRKMQLLSGFLGLDGQRLLKGRQRGERATESRIRIENEDPSCLVQQMSCWGSNWWRRSYWFRWEKVRIHISSQFVAKELHSWRPVSDPSSHRRTIDGLLSELDHRGLEEGGAVWVNVCLHPLYFSISFGIVKDILLLFIVLQIIFRFGMPLSKRTNYKIFY